MSTDAELGATIPPSREPDAALSEFISRFVTLHAGRSEACARCPFCETGGHTLKIAGAAWRTFCCGSHELNGNDAPGFYACWTNSTREEAIAKLGNGAGLPDAKPVEQVPLKRLPFWGWRELDKPALKDKAVWIHELSGSVYVWRELVLERVHLGLISSRIGVWEPLGMLANRRCVLVPENNHESHAMMAGLAAALYRAGHKQVMCLAIGLDERFGTRELPEPGEDVLKWAKARSKPYPKPNGEAPPGSTPLGDEELQQALEDAVMPPEFIAAKVAESTARVQARKAEEALGSPPAHLPPPEYEPLDAPQIAQRPPHRNHSTGVPVVTPSERVKAHERAARAEVLAGLVYTCIANVRPEAVRWLWPGRIPLGELTMIVGDPGLGKSQICASLASVVTNGGQWPVDRAYAEQGSVLILSAEDNIKHTIRPRLDAANADVSRCHTLQAVKRISELGVSFEGGFNLAEDLAKMSVLMDEIGDVRLVVIDPVSAYLGETDSHKNAEVRGMLAPLTTLAGQHNAAIILVSHLTKSQSANALMRVQGSIAFAALCRAVWGVTADKDNRQRRLFMPLKNNLGQDKTGLAYAIESAVLDIPDESGEPIPTSKVMWESELVETSVDEAFGASLSHDERTEMDEAKDFLREALAEGRVKASEVQRLSNAAGHSNRTLMRAKKALKVTSEREGFTTNAIWFWKLPQP